MLDQLVPPKKREEDKTYATKRFEERFRKEDEELRAIIEAQLANFESFKIIEETDEDEANMINDDPETLGSEISEISATTVEIVFGTTRSPDTTMMSPEEDNNEDGFDTEELSNVKTTQDPEEAKKENGVVEMDFLKKMAKQALQRKYKKVKKPKQLIEDK